jgi:hypothetical protein
MSTNQPREILEALAAVRDAESQLYAAFAELNGLARSTSDVSLRNSTLALMEDLAKLTETLSSIIAWLNSLHPENNWSATIRSSNDPAQQCSTDESDEGK